MSPGTDELTAPSTYGLDAGGIGTSIMMVPYLLQEGHTQIAMVRVDTAAANALKPLMEGTFGDDGLVLVSDIPVPAGTTDYSQFVVAAEDAGATAMILPLGGQEGIQILRAAQQLESELVFSSSLGSYPASDIESLGDYSSHIVLNAAIPPATFDDPAVDLMTSELGASGIEALQRPNLKSSPMRSWIGLFGLTSILRDAALTEYTPATVRAAVDAAADVDMLGLIPPWTPNAENQSTFTRINNPVYLYWQLNDGVFESVGEGDIVAEFEASALFAGE